MWKLASVYGSRHPHEPSARQTLRPQLAFKRSLQPPVLADSESCAASTGTEQPTLQHLPASLQVARAVFVEQPVAAVIIRIPNADFFMLLSDSAEVPTPRLCSLCRSKLPSSCQAVRHLSSESHIRTGESNLNPSCLFTEEARVSR